MTAIAVTIAGSDSGGGAGIQADLKTFSALSVYGASVITALTAQNTRGVQAIHDVPADFVREQMDSVFGDLAVNATKIGMLSRPETIAAVARGIGAHETGPIVVDPVMVAASGDPLIAGDAVSALRERLFPLASVITPNLAEAARLVGAPVATNRATMEAQAAMLLQSGPQAVLVKGGHLAEERGRGRRRAADYLLTGKGGRWFVLPWLDTRNTHGTGCSLSSAIAAGLAGGKALEEAVEEAKSWLHAALAAADSLAIGHGHGPVHHFHRYWSTP